MAGKKRKLPKDLREATAMVTACLDASKRIADARKEMKKIRIEDVMKARLTDLSTEDATVYLIARYGLKDILKICSVMSRLPDTLPAVYKARYMNECTNRQDADVIAKFMESHCQDLCRMKMFVDNSEPIVLVPPTSRCFECQLPLTINHQCDVSLLCNIIGSKFSMAGLA